ncbi:MAG: hypothetical protein JO069_12715, partial [Verrucomicrobia bacterium]|nr:hypothetical protein [Verrucomicrobiota bacterium]
AYAAPKVPGLSLTIFLQGQACDTLPYFIRFPKAWTGFPRVYGVDLTGMDGLKDLHLVDQDAGPRTLRLHLPPWLSPGQWPVLRDGNFFLFRFDGERLEPVTDPVNLYGQTLTPKKLDLNVPASLKVTHAFKEVVGLGPADRPAAGY